MDSVLECIKKETTKMTTEENEIGQLTLEEAKIIAAIRSHPNPDVLLHRILRRLTPDEEATAQIPYAPLKQLYTSKQG
jgi:hypothetical protein